MSIQYSHVGDLARAELYARQALEISTALDRNVRPTEFVRNLSFVLRDQGKYAEAERLSRELLKEAETRRGPDNYEVAARAHELATLRGEQGAWTEAVSLFDRGLQLNRKDLARTMAGMSDSQQLSFLRPAVVGLNATLSLGIARPTDPAVVPYVTSWLLNGKAMSNEALAERVLLTRDRSNPQLTAVVDRLVAVRRRLGQLTFSATGSPDAEMSRLMQEERELTVRVNTQRRALSDQWIDQAAVRRASPGDSVLIEFARITVRDYGVPPARRRPHDNYIALIIPPAAHARFKPSIWAMPQRSKRRLPVPDKPQGVPEHSGAGTVGAD